MTTEEFIDADRAGNFRAEIMDYGLWEPTTGGAVAVQVRAVLTEIWDGEAWQPWRQYNMIAKGNIWVIKKDGTLNEKSVESLIKATGWGGDIESVVQGAWAPTPCQVVLNEETYKEEVRYVVSFVNEFDRKPGGGMNTVTGDRAKELQARFGSPLRALAGNVKRNAAPTGSKPPEPPRGVTRQQTQAGAAANAVDDGIPF